MFSNELISVGIILNDIIRHLSFVVFFNNFNVSFNLMILYLYTKFHVFTFYTEQL